MALAISQMAGECAELGLLKELAVDAGSAEGGPELPLVCQVGGEIWLPYIHLGAWSSDAIHGFLNWLVAVRNSDYATAKIQVFSLDAVPPLVSNLLLVNEASGFQLDAYVSFEGEDFAANARACRALFRRHFSVELNGSESFKKADAIIEQHFPPPELNQVLPYTHMLIGAYLGEALRSCVAGAQWKRGDASLHMASWVLDTPKVTLNPLGKVEKRFVNGAEDSLAQFYSLVTSKYGG